MPVKKAVTARKTAAPRKVTPPVTVNPDISRPTDDEIRLRAYQLFLQRDGHAGDPMEDWLRAESELTGGMAVVAAAGRKLAARKPASRRSAS